MDAAVVRVVLELEEDVAKVRKRLVPLTTGWEMEMSRRQRVGTETGGWRVEFCGLKSDSFAGTGRVAVQGV
jgi:hypothetical protein